MKKAIILMILVLFFPIMVLTEEISVTIDIGDMGAEVGTTTTPPPPSLAIQASIESSTASGSATLDVKFDISKSHASTGKDLDKYELDFGDGEKKKGTWPTEVAELEKLKSIEHTYSKTAIAKLTVWEKDTGKTDSKTKQITIRELPIDEACKECSTMLQCLACVDQKLARNLYKE